MATGRPEVITQDVIDQYLSLVDSGSTRTSAARSVGFGVDSLRLYMQRHDIPLPSAAGIRERILLYLDQYKDGSLTQAEIAALCDTSQAYVWRVLNQQKVRKVGPNYAARFDRIIEHLTQHGGYPQAIARELGITYSSTRFNQYCKEINFDPNLHQFAHQRFGSWLTVAGPWTRQLPASYLVPALCTRCGTIYPSVSLINLKTGQSTCCLSCSKGSRGGAHKVKCIATGEVFCSIRTLCKHLGLANRYQQTRLLFAKGNSVEINGATYELLTG